jgi:hypothetical protein
MARPMREFDTVLFCAALCVCRMVEYVTPIRDPSVINILKNGGV